jgi:hypothetical protein
MFVVMMFVLNLIAKLKIFSKVDLSQVSYLGKEFDVSKYTSSSDIWE